MPRGKFQDPYKNVPHKGQRCLKDGKPCYWCFSNDQVGTVFRYKQRGWRPLDAQPVSQPMGEPRVLPGHGGTPVQPVLIHNPGFYYETEVHIECIEERMIPEGRIVLWMDHARLSDVECQAIAFQCMSLDEYQSRVEVQ
jgi:hypothetical protein